MLNSKFIFINLFIVLSLVANDGFDDEGGFDDEVIEVVKTKKKDDLIIYGFVTGSTNYSYDNKHTISSSKISTNTQIEYNGLKEQKLKATIKAYKDYSTNIHNDYDVDINEFTIEQTLNNGMDITFGRQIIVWGKSDNIRITDTLNPLDNTTPGMIDIEDLRLGRVVTKLDYYIDNWTMSTLVLHENRYSMMPELGSDYYSLMIANSISKEPSSSIDNSGVALSLSANLEGEDISLYYSNQYIDNKSYKSNMYGFAYNKVVDNFLIKTELAYFDNYDSNSVNSKIDSLIGLEYNGIDDGSISLEIASKDDDIQYAARFSQSYINQTLDFTALYSGFEKDLSGGGFFRVWIDYAIDDELTVQFGMINYSGGTNLMLETIKNNDRVFSSLKYNF